MKNHKLHSTCGEQTEQEIKYPRMLKNINNDQVILFSSRCKGVVLYVGSGESAIGDDNGWDATRMPYKVYNGPVTITGTDIND